MLSLPKILVPVDSAPACLAAAKHAAELARRFSSEIELLHVFQPPFYDFGAAEAGAASGNEGAADSASR